MILTFRALGHDGSEVATAETKRIFVKAKSRAPYDADFSYMKVDAEGYVTAFRFAVDCKEMKSVEIVHIQAEVLT